MKKGKFDEPQHYDPAAIFKELAGRIGVRPACQFYGLALQVGYSIMGGNDDEAPYRMGSLNERKILAAEANRSKIESQRETLAVMESIQYKGTRNSFDRPKQRRERMHKL